MVETKKLTVQSHSALRSRMHKMHMFQDHQQPLVIMVEFDLLPPNLGNPRDKSSPSGLGLANCLKTSCAVGRGRGKSKITSLSRG